MKKLLLSFAALSFLAACDAGAPPAGGATPASKALNDPANAAGHFVLRAPGGAVVEALIDNDNVTGPSISISRYHTATEHALRGTAFGNPMDVAITERNAKGIIGSTPVDISTEHRDGKIHVSGMFGGHPSDFEVNMKILKGRIGECTYDLSWNGKAYQGTRGCGDSGAPVSVSVPITLGKWSDPELGACLGMLMGTAASSTFAPGSVPGSDPNASDQSNARARPPLPGDK